MPPKYALKFLRWFCREDYLEEIEGDLTEVFERQYETSPKKAKWKFSWSVIRYFRPAFIKSFKSSYHPSLFAMLRHNLLLTFRTFKRYKTSFFINLIGLSSGLACTLLIYLWVNDELSVDKFHENDKQLFQVMMNHTHDNKIQTMEQTHGILAKALMEEFPEVEASVAIAPRIGYKNTGILSSGKKYIKANSKFVGKDFFKMFSYTLLEGDKNQVLSDKSSVVISEEIAINLFHTTGNAVGKVIQWEKDDNREQFQITGVFQNMPNHSTMKLDLVFTYDLYLEKSPHFQTWEGASGPATYIKLKENTDVKRFNGNIVNFLKTKNAKLKFTLFTRPYSDSYLYSHYENGIQSGGRIEYVRLFATIAFFILLIACINFMNLATARASRRLKEIGIKKALGANRKVLILQFIVESSVITILSVILSVLLVVLFLPQFNVITEKYLVLALSPNLMLSLLGIIVFTALLSGSYPAFYL
ncbi:MAG: ABC transporter permease, partial [Bacteroidota bacterium]